MGDIKFPPKRTKTMTKRQRREHKAAQMTIAANSKRNQRIVSRPRPIIEEAQPVNAVRIESNESVQARMQDEVNNWIDASISHARMQTQQKV